MIESMVEGKGGEWVRLANKSLLRLIADGTPIRFGEKDKRDRRIFYRGDGEWDEITDSGGGDFGHMFEEGPVEVFVVRGNLS